MQISFPTLYHAHHARQMEDLPLWRALAQQAAGAVLELGCGTGRITLPLAQDGLDVTGVDWDDSMLRFLRMSARDAVPTLRLVQADFRSLPLAGGFRLVIVPCNTYSGLDEASRRATLYSVQRVLATGGTFALSIPNPDILRSLPRRSDLEVDDEFFLGDGSAVTAYSGWQRKKDTLTFWWAYDWMTPDGKVERFETAASHQIVPVETLVGEIGETIGPCQVWGGYDRYDLLSESEVLVLSAQKAAPAGGG